MNSPPSRPPARLCVKDVEGKEIEAIMGGDVLVVRRGMLRFDLTPDASLTLLRWLLWHALHGRWAPKPLPVEYPRPEHDQPPKRER